MQMSQKEKKGEGALLCFFFAICFWGISSFLWSFITGRLFAGQVYPNLDPLWLIPVFLVGVILLPIALYSLHEYGSSSAIFREWVLKTNSEDRQQRLSRREREERIRKEWEERRTPSSE
jgi:hypothetical protein